MPETAIHKNSQATFWKDKVWIAEQVKISPPTCNFILTEDAGEFDFRGFIPFGFNCGHDLRPLFFGNDIGHCNLIFPENLVEHDFDVVAGVLVADALPRVLADRQVSPTVLSGSLFRHAPRIIVFNRLASSRRSPARRMMRCISNKPRIS